MIHYTKYLSSKPKNKEWITFVHGAGGSSTIWFKQIKYFSQYYNLLLLDLRGHGKSKAIPLNPFNKKSAAHALPMFPAPIIVTIFLKFFIIKFYAIK